MTGTMDAPLNINNLPNEILIEIFSYLSLEDIAFNVQSVCVRWSEVCLYDALWKNTFFSPGEDVSEDYIISALKKMPKLQCFQTETESTKIFDALGQHCKELRKLEAPKAPFIWLIPGLNCIFQNLFKECTKLEELTITDIVLFSKVEAKVLAQCRNLKSLSVRSTLGIGVKLDSIADGCPSLQCLEMDGPWHFSNMRYFLERKKNTLTSLKIRHTSEKGCCVLPLLPIHQSSLRELQLEGDCDSCSSDSISAIRSLPKLTSFKCFVPSQIDDVFVNASTTEAMPQLLELEIESSTELSTAFFNSIYSNCTNLLRLRFKNMPSLRPDALELVHMCSNLEELELRNCPLLTDTAFVHIIKCNRLKYLTIYNCPRIKNGFSNLIYLTGLKYLTILDCHDSFLPLESFPLYLKQLRKLTLSQKCCINRKVVSALRDEMPHLRIEFT